MKTLSIVAFLLLFSVTFARHQKQKDKVQEMLSQWHSKDTRPTHIGLYQVMDGEDLGYSWWDGYIWGFVGHVEFWGTHKQAEYYASTHSFFNRTDLSKDGVEWRGIVK